MTRRLPMAAVIVLALTLSAMAEEDALTQPSTRPTALPADQMLDRMLKPGAAGQALQPTPDTQRVDRTTGAGAVAPNAPQLTVMREGSYIVDRLGRMIPSSDGQQMEFTFDADGKTLQDPPLLILPNLKLMAMERASELASRELRFRITGMVTEYKGRNYILLDKVVVVPEKE